jgi:hypothetical protein
MMSDIVIYEDGKVELKATLQENTIWLNQKQMGKLFGVQRPAITKHLSNIFKSGELEEEVVCSILEHTTQHGAIPIVATSKSEQKRYNHKTCYKHAYG